MYKTIGVHAPVMVKMQEEQAVAGGIIPSLRLALVAALHGRPEEGDDTKLVDPYHILQPSTEPIDGTLTQCTGRP